MAQILKLRRSAIPGAKPTISQLDFGELALNTYDGKIFMRKSSSLGDEVIEIGVTSVTSSYSLFAVSSSYANTASWAIHALTASSADSFVVRNTLTASGLYYPSTDGIYPLQVLQTNAAGVLTFGDVQTTFDNVYNAEATTLIKGTPVYVSGAQGANPKVYRADAANPSKMPVTYIISENIDSGNVGRGITLGHIEGIDLTGYTEGTAVYVAAGGGWTSIRPTGSVIIQFLGLITKTGTGGKGLVLNPGPATLPNLQSGYIWLGDSNSYPTATSTSSLVVSNSLTASSADNFLVRGTLTAQTIVAQVITSSTEYVTGSTIFGSLLSNTHQFTGSVNVTGSLAVNNSNVILTNQTSSMSVATASYVLASNVAGLSLFQISTGSITASVGVTPTSLFLIKSGSKAYFNISSSGETTIYSSNFMIRDFNTNEMVFQISASKAYFDFDGITIATQSVAPTGSASIGSILFTSDAMYVGIE